MSQLQRRRENQIFISNFVFQLDRKILYFAAKEPAAARVQL